MGDIEGVRTALKKGSDVNAKGKYGSTALQDASFSGYENIVRLLLDNGADARIKGVGGLTALHYAAQSGHKNIVQLLLNSGADINGKSDGGLTALHFAATKRNDTFIRFLLKNGADSHAKDDQGQTALHKAAMNSSPSVVMTLISAGSDIDIVDLQGRTPLLTAKEHNNSQVARILENEYLVQGVALNKDILEIEKNVEPAIKPINPDGIAVIIGIQKYNHKDLPEVAFAHNDAEAMRGFITKSLGYKDGNIIYSIDPTKADLEMIFGIKGNHMGILYDYIKPGKSDVIIYYSGHGAPDVNSNRAYFIPKNGNPDKIAFSGYALDVFYENIARLPVKRMSVVIDACFSGGTDSGKWIVANASPALIKIVNPAIAKKHIAIFTSSQSNQISSWYPEKKHGLFTYFFLQAVNGYADKNKNKKITYNEIFNYVSDRAEGVPYYAKRLHGGRVQTPMMHAVDKDAVFVEY